jgi:hypothetical protein
MFGALAKHKRRENNKNKIRWKYIPKNADMQ